MNKGYSKKKFDTVAVECFNCLEQYKTSNEETVKCIHCNSRDISKSPSTTIEHIIWDPIDEIDEDEE
jgi:DNA-directed RNA polymerase subunit RPC12/RpoP